MNNSSYTSSHVGVCYDKTNNKWICCIKIKGKYCHKKSFKTQEEAIISYEHFIEENKDILPDKIKKARKRIPFLRNSDGSTEGLCSDKKKMADYLRDYRLQNHDKLCEYRKANRIRQRGYYQTSKTRILLSAQNGRQEWIIWCNDWKMAIGCITCGERNPVCLDFHHLDGSTKLYHITAMKSHGDALRIVELMKCVTVCANCHRKAHSMNKISKNNS